MRRATDAFTPRVALVVALGVAWLNFLLTVKWAHLPGSLNGWKRPWYAAALAAATLFTLFSRNKPGPVRLAGLRWLVVAGAALVVTAYLWSFPPSTWNLIPFADDWVPRYQSTVDGIALLRRGAVVGWQWAFLGGYQTSADLSQSLTIIGFVPMTLFGAPRGFHLLHLFLVVAIPSLVFIDIAADGRRDVARLTAFFACICAVGMFGTIMPSGDTNSIAGVFCAMLALAGSRMARTGRRWGGAILVLGLTLALYMHVAFFLYATLYLLLEALFYRDARIALRAVMACAVAGVAALPQHIELLRYRDYFNTNNLIYAPGPIDWRGLALTVYYNTEILLHPHRWYNDYLSLTCVFLVVFIWAAIQPGRSRPRFYAWLVLATMAMLRCSVAEAGYLLTREMHMLAVLAPAPLAWFVIEHSGDRRLAWALVAVIGLYVQAKFEPIRHVADVREFDAALADRLRSLDGHLVLLENSPHRDLDSDPRRRTERTPFDVHFEAMLPPATGRLYYGQAWDGWHWTPFRGQVVAGGAFRGRTIAETPVAEFVREMRKWGVRHLVVWSEATRQYLDSAPANFERRWASGLWVQYEMRDPDTRAVVTETGTASLGPIDPLGGIVRLSGMRRGERVVIRQNYFPVWTARVNDRPVALFAADGQLAFDAPQDGDYAVTLAYPRRLWLQAIALAAFVIGAAALTFTCVTPSSRSAAA